MYPATAAIGAALQRLKRFPSSQNQLILDAQVQLTVAYQLMNDRWKIHYSIYWNGSNAKTRHTVESKLEGMAFDAKTALINAGDLLNAYTDRYQIPDEDIPSWCNIIQYLNNANRWILRDYIDSNCKQLELLSRI